jgi:hypothetical protein
LKNSLDFQGAVIPKVVLKRDDEMGFDQFLKKIFLKFFLSFFPLLINFNLFFYQVDLSARHVLLKGFLAVHHSPKSKKGFRFL